MKVLAVFLLFCSITAFGFFSFDSFDDYDFPNLKIEFLTDFEINKDQFSIQENDGTYLSAKFSNVAFDWENPIEFVFFIDTSYYNIEHDAKIIAELKAFYEELSKKQYNASMRIVTSAQYTNQKYFINFHNLYFFEGTSDALFDHLFEYNGISNGQIDYYLSHLSDYVLQDDLQYIFIFISNGKGIGIKEFENSHKYVEQLRKLKSFLFVYTDFDHNRAKVFFDSLISEVGGELLDLNRTEISGLLDSFYNQKFYRNVISYQSNQKIIDEKYFLKLSFYDRREEYTIKIQPAFSQVLKINSITALPFILKPGEVATLECVLSSEKNITVNWTAESGFLSDIEENQQVIRWQAPEEPGFYRIDVECDNGNNKCHSSIYVFVE